VQNTTMRESITMRGKVSDSRHIELAEPIEGVGEEVEVVIRPIQSRPKRDVFEFIASLPTGTRTKEDIDRQMHEERDSWDNR
jgi:hypothetical protein